MLAPQSSIHDESQQTLIDAIGQAPGQVREIVRYADQRAPAYMSAAAGMAMQIYPGFRNAIAEVLAESNPQAATTATIVAEVPPTAASTPPQAYTPEASARSDYGGRRSDWAFVLGLGVGLEPDYEGGDQQEAVFLPLVDIAWRDTIFLSTRRGVGINILSTQRLTIGASITYRFGRDDDEDERLRGAGGVDDAIEAGLFGALRFGEFHVRCDLRQDVIDAHGGTIAEFAAGITGEVSPKDVIVLEGITHWASDSYMQTYFGVNASQTNGGLRSQFSSSAAFKDVGAALQWIHAPVPGLPWFGTLTVTWTRLLGDALDSPLTDADSENQFAAHLVVGYRF